MKAFVEFGREMSDTKSTSHAEFKTWLKLVPHGACFHFIGLCCYKALTVNADKTCKNCCLKVVPIKCQGSKTIFWLIYTLSIVIQK